MKKRMILLSCFALLSLFITLPLSAEYSEDSIAIIKKFRNDVKMKRSSEIAWEDVFMNMDLFEGDRVKTTKNSSAIAFYDNTTNLKIKENTLVVIKKMVKRNNLRRTEIELTKGTVTGSVKANPEEDIVLNIFAKSGDKTANIRLDSRFSEKDSNTDIEIKPNEDIFVHVNAGEAKVTSDGITVKLNENESTIIEPGSSPLPPWLGIKQPFFSTIILVCVGFLFFFIFVSIIVLTINKKKKSEEF